MIKALIEKHLPEIAAIKGNADLGDRSEYIGASDVGQCPRKTIMGKLFPQSCSIEQTIVFERGHLAENIVFESLIEHCESDQSKSVVAQYEIAYPGNRNIKAHIDFVLNSPELRTVVEVKTATMVSEPYDSWVEQCIFQQGLLMLENPEIPVKGYVLCIDLKTGKIAEFEVEYDETIFQNLMERAEYLLGLLEQRDLDLNSIPLKQSVLCGYCSFQTDCPVYSEKGNIPDDLKELIRKYYAINIKKKETDKEIETLKEVITSYGPFKAVVDGIKANYTVSTLMSLDIKALKANEPDLAEMYSTPKEFARLTIG